MIECLRGINATGFETYPIQVEHTGEPLSGFEGAKITGRGGSWDESRGDVKHRPPFVSYSGIYMKEEEWDGSDVFLIPGMGMRLFFSERACQALDTLGLRGAKLIRNDRCSRKR